ncbi:MAG: bifunctional (p)ppGpp synthetase/guanosine-3',5'-bis(diphosphate) 3'-pyrophosphohydrolase, partial [Eggerthellaceae bacterium]|nr:bifunctional (p)ppGpp synthetase/guanosine-3',5'-bis(diphosphate) 3'-pyrophosphohydrolase [Eggerthellaceae bacterium]
RLLKLLVDRGTEDAEKPGLGYGEMSTGKLPPMITSVKRPKKHEAHTSNGVVVKGLNDVLVKLARCCNPVPGDDIIGFVTRGRGVSVHRADCPNAKSLLSDPDRIIEVSWDQAPTQSTSYKVELYMEARDRMNLLRDVTAALSDMRVSVLSSSTATHADDMVEMCFLFQLSDVAQIDSILRRMRGIDGVFEATRLVPKAGRERERR